MRKLEIGYSHSFEVRKESCITRCIDEFTVLFLSDLHLNKFSGDIVSQMKKAIHELDPTIILFGGDYVDSAQGLIYFNELLESVSHRRNVFAISGNHDQFRRTDELQSIAERNSVTWIGNQSHKMQVGITTVRIASVNSVDNGIENEFSILVLHNPREIEKIKRKYDLAFAGHLHGSQFVFWKKENELYPGKLFYRWNILKTTLNGNPYFISKGLGDTLPVRYNCKREMIFVEVSSKSK